VLRMLEDGRAVTKAKAGGLAPAGASESGVWQPGWRQASGWRPRHRSLGAAGEWQVVGAQVRSGGGGHAGHGNADLSRVRGRGAGARGIFLDNAVTSVGHP
jgi:hypothetical protein